MSEKAPWGGTALVVGILLEMNGFVTGAKIQPESAVDAITAIVCFGSIGLLLLALIVASRFRLDRHTHQVLLNEIARLKESKGDKSSVTPETRTIIESLTGVSYEQVWQDDKPTDPPCCQQAKTE
ncbi:hypothetical protein OJE16_10950 [Pantoea tagorei]